MSDELFEKLFNGKGASSFPVSASVVELKIVATDSSLRNWLLRTAEIPSSFELANSVLAIKSFLVDNFEEEALLRHVRNITRYDANSPWVLHIRGEKDDKQFQTFCQKIDSELNAKPSP